jgi:hypothetical protein
MRLQNRPFKTSTEVEKFRNAESAEDSRSNGESVLILHILCESSAGSAFCSFTDAVQR